ncbi:trimeric intracellular cation channel family protein [Aeoliella sp. ICT_H6.2]|uniref:Trimeric intracellular cation channel family protein n=1 Tax=Aeoliella straminimaris TaxID=2954799 RepID=A0A9X2F878_9BACT|nr:trimeric intracellular cation channel family protein [Aeoliella straminimaris]MCO6043448.1 trimeric intracellular cation channel family protein [Aeoliella straminimaris]
MLQVIELLAVICSAIYGVLLARQHKMDFVGVFSLAFIVAFGGGTLRDLFLDRHPLFWIRASHYPVIVFGMAVAAFFILKVPKNSGRLLDLADALGLGFFSIAGADAALDEGTSWFIAAMLGAVTGTFGGVIGDTICNRIPSLFRPSTPLYATCSFVGSWIFILLSQVPAAKELAAPVAIAMIILFRLLALHRGWKLPALSAESEEVAAEHVE